MRTLFLECNMGAAGDMLTAALAELIPDRSAFADRMNHIGIPGLQMHFTDRTHCGIRGNHAIVCIDGEEEISNDVSEDGHDHVHIHDHHDHEHHHSHEHEHHHEHHAHHHSGLDDIMEIVNRLDIPACVKEDVRGVYALIAEAEAVVHGTEAAHIHFHEVGMMDAVCDVTAVCLLMQMIAPERVIVSPVCTGFGEVRCMHGIVPVPSPATQYLLSGIPSYAGHIRGELLTPTGAALLKYFADEFGQRPVMTVEKTGYGMGMKEFESANCVRAILGETSDHCVEDRILEIRCNIDDMTGEEIGFAAGILRQAGALDVSLIPIQMKKDRPGIMIDCICRPEDEEIMCDLLLRHTSTLGVRITPQRRVTLSRRFETVETKYGPILIKISEGRGITKRKPEYDSVAKAAERYNVSYAEVLRAVTE